MPLPSHRWPSGLPFVACHDRLGGGKRGTWRGAACLACRPGAAHGCSLSSAARNRAREVTYGVPRMLRGTVEPGYLPFFCFDHVLTPQTTPIPIKKTPKPAKKIPIVPSAPMFSPPKSLSVWAYYIHTIDEIQSPRQRSRLFSSVSRVIRARRS